MGFFSRDKTADDLKGEVDLNAQKARAERLAEEMRDLAAILLKKATELKEELRQDG
jgi:hypothetical protein